MTQRVSDKAIRYRLGSEAYLSVSSEAECETLLDLRDCRAANAQMREALPDDLRMKGWLVAVHNDYALDGKPMTFWLLTNPTTGRFVRGEGATDREALNAARALVDRVLEGSTQTGDEPLRPESLDETA